MYQILRGKEVLGEYADVFEAYREASKLEKRDNVGDFPYKNSDLVIKEVK